jgi:hypothetical protein
MQGVLYLLSNLFGDTTEKENASYDLGGASEEIIPLSSSQVFSNT